jgi:hypothetical protein
MKNQTFIAHSFDPFSLNVVNYMNVFEKGKLFPSFVWMADVDQINCEV